jgi:hypothetical protein
MTTTEGTPMPTFPRDPLSVTDAEANAMNAGYIRGEITRERWEDWNRRRADPLSISASGLPHTIDGRPYQEPVDDTDPTGRVVGYVVLCVIALVVIGGPIVLAWLLGGHR